MVVLLGANLYAWTELTSKNENIISQINEKLDKCSIPSK